MLIFLKYLKRNIGSMCFYGNFCFTNSHPNFRTTYLKISIYVWQNSFQTKGTLPWNVSNLISVFRSKQFESINNPNYINLCKERNWFLALIFDPYIFTTCLRVNLWYFKLHVQDSIIVWNIKCLHHIGRKDIKNRKIYLFIKKIHVTNTEYRVKVKYKE